MASVNCFHSHLFHESAPAALDPLCIHQLIRDESSKTLLEVRVTWLLSSIPPGENRSPRLDECLVNLLEVYRDGSVRSLHCCNRCLVVLSDPLVQVFSVGAGSFVQFLTSPLETFRHVVLVLLLSFLPCSHHEVFPRLFVHLCSHLSHGSCQSVVAFGHQHFPSGPVTSSGVFCAILPLC